MAAEWRREAAPHVAFKRGSEEVQPIEALRPEFALQRLFALSPPDAGVERSELCAFTRQNACCSFVTEACLCQLFLFSCPRPEV